MIMGGYRVWVPRRQRSRGLGQSLDWAGNPVNCPNGTNWDAGACIQTCSQSDPAAQFACVQSNQNAWNAAGAAQASGASQYTDPLTGQVISFTPPMSTAAWNAVTTAYSTATGLTTGQAPPSVTASQAPSLAPVVPLTTVTTIPTCAAGSHWVPNADACLADPLPPPPQQVVNPSPGTQSTATGTVGTSVTSALSQANGTVSASGGLLSTVAGYVNQYPSLVSGISNSTLLAVVGVGAGVLLLMAASQGRR